MRMRLKMCLHTTLGILLVICSSLPIAMAKPTITGSGEIPRDAATTYLDLNLQITNISKALVAGEAKFAHRLKIYFAKNTAAPIPFEDKKNDQATELDKYVIKYAKDEFYEKDSNENINVKFYFRITGPASGIKDLLAQESNSKITFNIEYRETETSDAEKADVVATKELGVANTAPLNIKGIGIFRGVSVDVDKTTTIKFTNGKSKAATGLNLYVIKRGAGGGEVSVDALVHDATATSDTTKTTCNVNTNATNNSECVTCEELPAYFKSNSLPAEVKFGSTTSTTSAAVTGLDLTDGNNDPQDYIVFATYKPDGVKRSKCLVVTPSENLTVTEELDPGLNPKEGNPQCFIATATYGSPSHRDVHIFRAFRDRVLLRIPGGVTMVAAYYRFSPPVAAFIEHHAWAKNLSRLVLYPFARFLEWAAA